MWPGNLSSCTHQEPRRSRRRRRVVLLSTLLRYVSGVEFLGPPSLSVRSYISALLAGLSIFPCKSDQRHHSLLILCEEFLEFISFAAARHGVSSQLKLADRFRTTSCFSRAFSTRVRVLRFLASWLLATLFQHSIGSIMFQITKQATASALTSERGGEQ